MKIIIAVFIILGMVVLVSATSLVAYNYERVVIRERVITPEIHATDLGFIEADCNRDKINITLSKNDALSFITPVEIYQEVEAPLKSQCPDYDVTNVVNWKGEALEADPAYPDFKSFDRDAINRNKCIKTNPDFNYNQTNQECFNQTLVDLQTQEIGLDN